MLIISNNYCITVAGLQMKYTNEHRAGFPDGVRNIGDSPEMMPIDINVFRDLRDLSPL